MKVTVDLDPRDVWRIQEKAEQLGVRPGDVLRDEITLQRRSRDMREKVRELVKAGLCDADIAARLHYSNGWVADTRRGLGLPANRRYPARTDRKTA
jgi:hypothetical protein